MLVEQKITERFHELGRSEPDFERAPAEFNIEMSGAQVLPGALMQRLAWSAW
jgi:hypothetical protein